MQSITEIKTAVFAQIATSTTAQVKQWAEQHNLDVDLRTKEGWLTVLNAIASQLKDKAIATAKEAAVAVRDADYEQLAQDAYNKALEIKVAATDGAIETYRTLKQHWTPAIRLAWEVTKFCAFWTAIAAIYCLRAGQRFRAFVDEFEDTGMAPHQIGWYFAKPVLRRARVTVARRWALVKERAIALSAQRRVREAAVGAVCGFVMFTGFGLIG